MQRLGKLKRCALLLWLFYKKTCVQLYIGIRSYYREYVFLLTSPRLWCFAPYFFYLVANFLLYFFLSPYSIVKRYQYQRGRSNATYGETPIALMHKICQQLCLEKKDHFFDLGAGRGVSLAWVSAYYQCKATGVEMIPGFVWRSRFLHMLCRLNRIKTRCDNLLHTDLSGATCLYLYGTTLSAKEIACMGKRINSLRTGVKVVTVSYSLLEYGSFARIRCVKKWQGHFAWGSTDIFAHEVVD